MIKSANRKLDDSALELLAEMDRQIPVTLAGIEANRGQGVEDRARYGDLVKRLVRELGEREAASAHVSTVLLDQPTLAEVGTRMQRDASSHRELIARIESMSRGVPGVSLNAGQDIDTELSRLGQMLSTQIAWELDEAIPTVRLGLSEVDRADMFHSARYVRRHALTNIDPKAPRWRERARVVSWILSIVDHLKDYPTAAKRAG